ncbi:MAG: type II secretion system minor pseudopilin GspJ [Gammaproteobacteria bacterium]|nr:type II secretion system minor pseudopilin GspJ [Gammaproteobacteria bacterium]
MTSLRVSCHRPQGQRGFTLLELIVATGIFALLSLMAFGGLRSVLDTEAASRDTGTRLADLQTALWFMGRDMSQMAPREIRDAFGDPRPALVGSAGPPGALEFTRGGWDNPQGLARSNLRRVAYRVTGGSLERLTWESLDRVQGSEPTSETLVDGVANLALRYLDGQRQWGPAWPPAGGTAGALPLAVEVVLELDDWGPVRRVFRVAG